MPLTSSRPFKVFSLMRQLMITGMVACAPHFALAAQGGSCPEGSAAKLYSVGGDVTLKVVPLMGCQNGRQLDAAHSPVIEFLKGSQVTFKQVGGQWMTVTNVRSVALAPASSAYSVHVQAWNGGNGVDAGTDYDYAVDAASGAVTRSGAKNYCRGAACSQAFWKAFVVAKPAP